MKTGISPSACRLGRPLLYWKSKTPASASRQKTKTGFLKCLPNSHSPAPANRAADPDWAWYYANGWWNCMREPLPSAALLARAAVLRCAYHFLVEPVNNCLYGPGNGESHRPLPPWPDTSPYRHDAEATRDAY